MGYKIARSIWELAELQHGVVGRRQLLEFGFSPRAITHRIERGRLHRIGWGVYAVGRPHVTRHGRWMAAVLACGQGAALSHASAAALLKIRPADRKLHVCVSDRMRRRRNGITVHRCAGLDQYVTRYHNIPVTNPILTLVDIAPGLSRDEREAAINEADKRDLVDPERLRAALDDLPPRPGIRVMRETLDRHTFVFTESALERYFLPIARRAGLTQPPLTGVYLNGFKVDFYWPGLGLVIETDGLRYHRTPAQQAADSRRDQAHVAAGLTPLRFTHGQIRYESGHVEQVVADTTTRLLRSRVSWETERQA